MRERACWLVGSVGPLVVGFAECGTCCFRDKRPRGDRLMAGWLAGWVAIHIDGHSSQSVL